VGVRIIFSGTFPPRRTARRHISGLGRVSTLPDLSKEFEDGGWRRQAQFRIPAPTSAPVLPTPELLDSARAKELLQVVADRVAQQPLRQ